MVSNYHNGGIISKFNKNEFGEIEPQLIQNEEVYIWHGGKASLDQYPFEGDYGNGGIIIEGYRQVDFQDQLGDKDFKVDYNEGNLFFNSSQDGKTVRATYYGIGKEWISANRVATEVTQNGDIAQTLQDQVVDLDKRIVIMDKIKEDYLHATHTDLVKMMPFRSFVCKDDVCYKIDLEFGYYNPRIDILFILEDGVLLVENKHYEIDGLTVKLNGFCFKKGETITYFVLKGVKDLPPVGSDGSSLMDGSVNINKLTQDLQERIKSIQHFEAVEIFPKTPKIFIAPLDETIRFQLDIPQYNPNVDRVKLNYQGVSLREDVNFKMDGNEVQLGFPLKKGEKIECQVWRLDTKLPEVGSDGSRIMNGSITKEKLSSDIQTKLDNIDTNVNVQNGIKKLTEERDELKSEIKNTTSKLTQDISNKLDSSYTQTIQDKLNEKADKSILPNMDNYYTKFATDTLIDNKFSYKTTFAKQSWGATDGYILMNDFKINVFSFIVKANTTRTYNFPIAFKEIAFAPIISSVVPKNDYNIWCTMGKYAVTEYTNTSITAVNYDQEHAAWVTVLIMGK